MTITRADRVKNWQQLVLSMRTAAQTATRATATTAAAPNRSTW